MVQINWTRLAADFENAKKKNNIYKKESYKAGELK